MPTPTVSDTPLDERSRTEILSSDSLEFLGELHAGFDARRRAEAGRPEETRRVFEEVALGDDFPDFLTEKAYALLD
ncbi:MAG: hypothetical protein ACRDPE_18985 [Solirubrobacterales bacterium]